uniref:Uncharacterized protein n=1 Tax=Chromera velia CCMP2878 TaxID=1169474 RepID=A0A0G4HES5_9ALVE|eukprot:Cvel_26684.t1-p1 / transcript=Cvel_26684.t1 / gene=Cvel_26684 / organism=Chromera_velia_CCMP2878 / gene_product=hypothetical protein / transcript_product=hypothetical protein / location=Cvel_scaffold3214:12894-13112(-) / protein_length=73 / sequence_SO=supercontig / SO=protein_coding / is_pseudo=false
MGRTRISDGKGRHLGYEGLVSRMRKTGISDEKDRCLGWEGLASWTGTTVSQKGRIGTSEDIPDGKDQCYKMKQ